MGNEEQAPVSSVVPKHAPGEAPAPPAGLSTTEPVAPHEATALAEPESDLAPLLIVGGMLLFGLVLVGGAGAGSYFLIQELGQPPTVAPVSAPAPVVAEESEPTPTKAPPAEAEAEPAPAPAAPEPGGVMHPPERKLDPIAPPPSDRADRLVTLGWTQVGSDPEGAERTFRKVLADEPHHSGAAAGLGVALLEQGKKTDATEYLCEASEKAVDPKVKRQADAVIAKHQLDCG